MLNYLSAAETMWQIMLTLQFEIKANNILIENSRDKTNKLKSLLNCILLGKHSNNSIKQWEMKYLNIFNLFSFQEIDNKTIEILLNYNS